jgi:mRNA interferase MazF
MVVHKQFDIYLVKLDPAFGAEIKKSRPAVVISPDAINKNLQTVIVAPLTHSAKYYPSRVLSNFNDEPGQIALDQIRAVDKRRLTKKLGRIDASTVKIFATSYKPCFKIL